MSRDPSTNILVGALLALEAGLDDRVIGDSDPERRATLTRILGGGSDSDNDGGWTFGCGPRLFPRPRTRSPGDLERAI